MLAGAGLSIMAMKYLALLCQFSAEGGSGYVLDVETYDLLHDELDISHHTGSITTVVSLRQTKSCMPRAVCYFHLLRHVFHDGACKTFLPGTVASTHG